MVSQDILSPFKSCKAKFSSIRFKFLTTCSHCSPRSHITFMHIFKTKKYKKHKIKFFFIIFGNF